MEICFSMMSNFIASGPSCKTSRALPRHQPVCPLTAQTGGVSTDQTIALAGTISGLLFEASGDTPWLQVSPAGRRHAFQSAVERRRFRLWRLVPTRHDYGQRDSKTVYPNHSCCFYCDDRGTAHVEPEPFFAAVLLCVQGGRRTGASDFRFQLGRWIAALYSRGIDEFRREAG